MAHVNTIQRYANLCLVWFTKGVAAHKPPAPTASQKIISFNDASPTIKPLLDTVRDKIILPQYLPKDQRKKMYSPKFKALLDRDPFVLEIDGEVHKFPHQDMRMLPNTNKSIIAVINAMKTRADFQLLPRLLEGVCVQAGRNVDRAVFCKAIRSASYADAIPVIIDCIKRVKSTGLRLDIHETSAQLFTAIQEHALKHGWTKEATETALGWSQQALDIIETEELHKPMQPRNSAPVRMGFPTFRDPLFLAARLHLAAALAVKHHKGRDTDRAVKRYAEQLVKLWPKPKGLLNMYDEDAMGRKEGGAYLLKSQNYLCHAAPIYSGLMLAQVVLGDTPLSKALAERADILNKEITMAVSHEEQRGTKTTSRGLDRYKAYVEAKPWEA